VKRTLYDRVDGDLIDAIARARKIDQRLDTFRSSGHSNRRLSHEELVQGYCRDLEQRADADAIALATVGRYRSALAHYTEFTKLPQIATDFPYAAFVDRQFALGFSAFLGTRMVSANGSHSAVRRKMKGQNFVLAAVRAAFEWAAARDRGNLLPDGFHNPFGSHVIQRRRIAIDMTGEPDVTVEMGAAFLEACDEWQLRLFSPLALYGLRPSELIYLFREKLDEQFLEVCSIEDLAYMTKGRRNKRVPMIEPMYALLRSGITQRPQGLIYTQRHIPEPRRHPPLLRASLKDLIEEFNSRCPETGANRAADVLAMRNRILRDAGALTYKIIQGEFSSVAKKLGWPPTATLKDFRHSCNTALANGGMVEHERRYLLGQSPGKDAIVTYTHLNKLAEHFKSAAERELAPLLKVLRRRTT
jgi:integrase